MNREGLVTKTISSTTSVRSRFIPSSTSPGFQSIHFHIQMQFTYFGSNSHFPNRKEKVDSLASSQADISFFSPSKTSSHSQILTLIFRRNQTPFVREPILSSITLLDQHRGGGLSGQSKTRRKTKKCRHYEPYMYFQGLVDVGNAL